MRCSFRLLRYPLLILLCLVKNTYAKAAVTLVSFDAIPNVISQNITLIWETGTELDFAGFYIQRSFIPDSGFERLLDSNGDPIFFPALGEGGAGAIYMYEDRDVGRGVWYFYKLEMIDLDGDNSFSEIRYARLAHLFDIPLCLKH